MNEHWRNIKVNVISFAHVGTAPPLAGALQREEARRRCSRTVNANLATLCIGKFPNFFQRIRITNSVNVRQVVRQSKTRSLFGQQIWRVAPLRCHPYAARFSLWQEIM
jgi:hypothetical protein